MNNNYKITLVSGRFIRGSVMGSPHSSIVLHLSIQMPTKTTIEIVRRKISHSLSRLPPFFDENRRSRNSIDSEYTELLYLYSDLVGAIQLENGIPTSMPESVAFHVNNANHVILYLNAWQAKPAEIAIQWSIELLNRFFSQEDDVDIESSIEEARSKLAIFHEPSINNFYTIRAAETLNIPILHPLPGLLVLGTGARSRWSNGLISDATSGLGIGFARAKNITANMLRAAGLPGALHKLVTTKDKAIEAANELGYPVVVKPADADKGHGVNAGLNDSISVASAFDKAALISPNVLVERWVPGNTHRITVQDGQVIRAVRRIAGGVTGDGVHTIRELISIAQKDPRQIRMTRTIGRNPLALDQEAQDMLSRQGLNPETILTKGVYVRLRSRDNINAGGTNEELNFKDGQIVHPDNIRLAIDASNILRLDFAGIDLITTDISRSWIETNALICEVNAQPQMGGEHDASLYQNLLLRMFPNGWAINADLIVAPSETSIQNHIRDATLMDNCDVSVSDKQGLWIHGIRSTRAFESAFDAARALLQRPDVQHAVCMMTPTEIFQSGLPIPRWNSITLEPDEHYNQEDAAALKVITPWLKEAKFNS